MDIKDLQEAMKLQQEMTAFISQRVESLRKGKSPSLETLLKEKQDSLVRLRAEAEADAKERDIAQEHWNKRIEQRNAAVATLERELTEIKRQVADVKVKPKAAKKNVRTK